MSIEVQTDFGVLRRVISNGDSVWLLKCPGCGEWGQLDDDQLHGRVSVDHASMGCVGGYHETHNFAESLTARGH